jgi:hypothetical protein
VCRRLTDQHVCIMYYRADAYTERPDPGTNPNNGGDKFINMLCWGLQAYIVGTLGLGAVRYHQCHEQVPYTQRWHAVMWSPEREAVTGAESYAKVCPRDVYINAPVTPW